MMLLLVLVSCIGLVVLRMVLRMVLRNKMRSIACLGIGSLIAGIVSYIVVVLMLSYRTSQYRDPQNPRSGMTRSWSM